MSNLSLPRIVNVYFNPGNKTSLSFNQPKHLLAALVRRGANILCFKLGAEFCNEHLPEAYNNSLMDVNLATGVARMYPKAYNSVDVLSSLTDIAKMFKEVGLITEIRDAR